MWVPHGAHTWGRWASLQNFVWMDYPAKSSTERQATGWTQHCDEMVVYVLINAFPALLPSNLCHQTSVSQPHPPWAQTYRAERRSRISEHQALKTSPETPTPPPTKPQIRCHRVNDSLREIHLSSKYVPKNTSRPPLTRMESIHLGVKKTSHPLCSTAPPASAKGSARGHRSQLLRPE